MITPRMSLVGYGLGNSIQLDYLHLKPEEEEAGQNIGALKTNCFDKQRLRQLFDRKAPNGILIVSLPGLSDILFTDTAADHSPQNLSGLTHIESPSPRDADESFMMGHITSSGNF